MEIYYNPLDKWCKSVTGGVKRTERFTVRIKCPCASNVELQFNNDNKTKFYTFSLQKDGENFSADVSIDAIGLYWYCFIVDGVTYARSNDIENIGEIYGEIGKYQLVCYDENYLTPTNLQGGIIYQIFPDRFNKVGDFSVEKDQIKREDWGGTPTYKAVDGKVKNNDFFGGNFKGIIQKLDYLKSLNVSIIYLNPIFKAYSNHRYDTGDYEKIDEVLGTEEDFRNLIKKAGEKGISIVIDGVFNHTGDDSKYFNKYGKYDTVGAYQSQNSPYKNWYIFDNYPNVYKSWWGIDILPTVNKNCEEYEEYIAGENGILAKYLKMGVKGVRLDVVDELKESFVKKIRSIVKAYGEDNIVIGEVWEDATNKIAYGERREYFLGNELDSAMNYELKNAVINYAVTGSEIELVRAIKEQINNYPKQALDLLMNFFGTHDTPRILTALGRTKILTDKGEMEYEKLSEKEYFIAVDRLKAVATILFTLYGLPTVYYGDEVGMQGNIDPFNRKCFPWGNEDEEILEYFRKLTKIRAENPIFASGETKILFANNGVIVYERRLGNNNVIIAVNRGKEEYIINTSDKVCDLITGKVYTDKVTLNKNENLILYRVV